MDCQTGFISWFDRHIHNLKIINLMNNKFFWFEKKNNINLIGCLYVTNIFMFIVHCIVLLYLAGSQHSFVNNFLVVVLPAAL